MTLGCLCALTADRWTLMTLNGASFLMSLKCFLSVLPQTRKPLVEKKRRARINESLQELRTLLADTDVSTERTQLLHWSFTFALRHNEGKLWSWWCSSGFFPQFHSKMENAEVLELTVKKVEDILKNRKQGVPTFFQLVLL